MNDDVERANRPQRVSLLTDDAITPRMSKLLSGVLDGYEGSNVSRALLQHPDLFEAWGEFARYIATSSLLSARERELVILRTAVLCGCDYAWGQHVVIARGADVSISDPELGQVIVGPDAPGWSAHEADLLRAVDELHHSMVLSDATWAALCERFSQQQVLDLLFTVGQYHLSSMVLNSCGVPLDEGLPGLPRG